MGRKTDSIWAFSKKIEKDGKTRGLCNNCKEDLVPLVERMTNHVSKCKASPPADDIEIIDEPGPSTSKRKKQDVLPFFGTRPTQQHQLDRYMEEIQLKRSANDAIDFLKPIGTSLDKLQRNDCCLGEAYEIWQSIGLNTPEEYVEILEKRRKLAVTPVMLAANLLDHRYSGSNMSPIEVQEALAYIASVDDTCLADVTKFMARHTPYNEKLFEGSFADVSSSTWWKSGEKLGFDPNLITCAISIVSSVSSSGGLERQFSTLGMNYGKLRSHLRVEKAGKLAFLYRQLNNKD